MVMLSDQKIHKIETPKITTCPTVSKSVAIGALRTAFIYGVIKDGSFRIFLEFIIAKVIILFSWRELVY